jgi:hypothetical protein
MAPSREELEKIGDTPRGTYALMLVIAALLFVGWALLYFGRFLGNGPVR